MLKVKLTNAPVGVTIFMLCLYGFFVVCWFVNLYKLLMCDFASPWRDEIIHLIGLIPVASVITCWM
jgi:hypothetical protein